jgi:hypothetical protein
MDSGEVMKGSRHMLGRVEALGLMHAVRKASII